MHFHPILLVKAESLEEAKSEARNFCENECGGHSVFDYGDIVPDELSEWNRPLDEVRDGLPGDDHIEEAEKMLARAKAELGKQNYCGAGYFCRKAGELFSECFSTEHPVFNLLSYDYSRESGDGWYAIEADLHF